MNDRAPSSFRDGFLDATAWPIRPFESFVLQIVEAIEAGDEFGAMSLLRKHCPLLEKEAIPKNGVAELLATLRSGVTQLCAMLAEGSDASVREVFTHLRNLRLVSLDPRILRYLDDVPVPGEVEVNEDEEETTREIASIDAPMRCSAQQFRGYRNYTQQLSPFSTHQGIKGAEFERVLVVLDDDEGTHVQFSYDKFFGVKAPLARDQANMRDGKETAVERTRRLFYVCCTRALSDLVVVYFTTDPVLAEQKVLASDSFPNNNVLTEAALTKFL